MPKYTYVGVREGPWSLAQIGVQFIAAMGRYGWEALPWHNYDRQITSLLIANDFPPPALHQWVHHPTNVCIYTWELDGAFPKPLREVLARYEMIWSYSAWGSQLMHNAGLYSPRSGLGIDFDVYRPPAKRPENDKLTALYVGGTDPRHAMDVLGEIITKSPDVQFIVKLHPSYPVSNLPFKAGPNVTIRTSNDSTEDMVSLYQQADVLLHPAKSVGFSLPVLEALACGTPVISTDLPPVREFESPAVTTIPATEAFMRHHIYDTKGIWHVPDTDKFVEALNSFKPIRVTPEEIARLSRRYSWEFVGDRFYHAVMQVQA